jgi:hypothetical protein
MASGKNWRMTLTFLPLFGHALGPVRGRSGKLIAALYMKKKSVI